MQTSIGRSQLLRQSTRIIVVQPQISLQAQPMDIENDTRPQSKPVRCNSKRTFGTNITNCMSRNSLPKAPIKPLSPSRAPKPAKLKMMESQRLEQPVVSLPIGVTEILPYQYSIACYLEHCEAQCQAPPDFMLRQEHIDQKMRAILVNWLVDVHDKFRLRKQTLFLTVHLIDSYLHHENIARTELQLLGIASLFTACKYEQVLVPDIRRFVEVCEGAYSNWQVLNMESRILLAIQFNLSWTSAMSQIEHKIMPLDLSQEVLNFSSFLLHLCLLEYQMCKYKQNLMALSAIYLSNKLLNTKRIRSSNLIERYNLDEETFKCCLREMLEVYKRKDQVDLHAVRKKFAKCGLQ